jgi:hypothetical protein
MSNLNAWSNINGTWRKQGYAAVKIEGSWRPIIRSFVNINGTWFPAGLGVPPAKPTIVFLSNGFFQIQPYTASLTYERIFRGGSGDAIINTSNGVIQLTGGNCSFDIVAKYGPKTPASVPTFIERKQRSFSCRAVSYTETVCDCRLDAQCGGCLGPGQSCPPGQSQSWGQCGCPGPMCWVYYNGVVCDICRTETRCCRQICDVLVNEPGYTYTGTEWYRII